MSHLAAGHSLEAFFFTSLVEFVGRKRGRLFVALSLVSSFLTPISLSVCRCSQPPPWE